MFAIRPESLRPATAFENKYSNLRTSTAIVKGAVIGRLVGWLVVLGLTAFETVFQSISGRLPKRGRKRRERTE